MFDYFNVRVYDDEKTNLLKHWDNTFRYISQAKNDGSKVLVHCKMGVSRSASVVIAYAMKAYDWTFSEALDHVKTQRNCIKPNKNFLTQLETYQGMLLAMKNKDKLQRSKSDTNLRSAKDARSLAGSEPTPLIQAFEAAARKSVSVTFHSRVLNCQTNRPKSWSPDNVESTVLLPKQLSLSMENLPPESKNDRTKNVRLPCINGQNYSVSQNQVFHLQENNHSLNTLRHCSSVKLIVKELESAGQQRKRGNYKTISKETWDPGERPSTEFMRQNPIENRLLTVRNQTSTTICDKTSSSKQLLSNSNEYSFSNLGRDSQTTKPPAAVDKLIKGAATSVAGVIAAVNARAANMSHPSSLHSKSAAMRVRQGSGAGVEPAAFFPKRVSVWTRRNTYNVNSNPTIRSESSPSSGTPHNTIATTPTSFMGTASDLEFHNGSKNIKNLIKSRIDCNTIMLTKSKYYSRNVT